MTENQEQVLKRLKELYYNLGTALRFHNPYELLVATILSAQATDKQVNKVTKELFQKYPDAYAIAALTPEAKISSPQAKYWSKNMQARYRQIAIN